jgi:hypothetical protein
MIANMVGAFNIIKIRRKNVKKIKRKNNGWHGVQHKKVAEFS